MISRSVWQGHETSVHPPAALRQEKLKHIVAKHVKTAKLFVNYSVQTTFPNTHTLHETISLCHHQVSCHTLIVPEAKADICTSCHLRCQPPADITQGRVNVQHRQCSVHCGFWETEYSLIAKQSRENRIARMGQGCHSKPWCLRLQKETEEMACPYCQ